jgi:hypothetical protein
MKWVVPKLWKDGECFIIGGGSSITKVFNIPQAITKKVLEGSESPSIYSPYFSPIYNKHVIGVNAAYKLGDWMDFVFFGDHKFFLQHKTPLLYYPGVKVSCHNKFASKEYYPSIKYLERDHHKSKGISTNPKTVSWNGNSGAAAISLAYHLGVKRITLLGFDMKLIENKQHWHSEYRKGGSGNVKGSMIKLPFNGHLKGFADIARHAKKLGIEILNCSPDSSITELKKVKLEDVL